MTVDPTGYSGPLNYLEIMLNGKHRRGSGLWAEANDLRRMVYDAAFTTKKPFTDSHGQLAHYARSFELFDKEDAERKAELFERIDTIPHLADFHVDIDFEGDLEASQREAIKLVDHYLSLGVSEPAIGIRFSGKKGFDICLPWQVLGVRPQGVMALNWTTYKLLGEALIAKLDLKGVDTGLWRKNGTIRLENTQHPSGLFKVRVTPEELRDLDTVRQIAQEPRRSLYSAEAYQESLVVAPGLRSLYLPLQARADAALLQTKALRHRTLDPEVLKELSTGMVACLKNIAASPPQRGSRNEVVFHAAMMLKHTGHEAEAATHYAREWLGSSATEVGADETVRSVYQGPYSGGCRWMREMGFASEAECRACPVGKHRYTRDARVIEAPPLLLPTAQAPTLEMQRRQLEKDFRDLNPDVVTIVRTPAGLGKSYSALRTTVQRVAQGERVLIFVKDTLKHGGLAADMIDELREKHDYHGKIQILKGRNEENCEDWTNAERIAKKGYSVGRTLCTTCPARSYCDYYGQYDRAYEPGVYIAPHAMLPIIFADERRGFSSEYIIHTDQETGVTQRIGGKLSLIVIDEDALDVMIDRFFVGKYHLINELKHKQRRYKVYDKLAGRNVIRTRDLDKNWLRVVEWLLRGIEVKGPVMPTLASIARADGSDIRAALLAIDPAGIIDPDYRHNKGHKPFTERLYQALVAESPRLKDGNYTIWNTGGGMEVMGLAPVSFPSGIPVVVLDAYADQDLYERYYRAAGVNRMVKVKEYPVREHANVTYVLGANLLSRDIERYEQGIAPNVTKVNRIMKALRRLTEDGVETYVVAKRSFFASQVWKDWEPELPNCVAEGEAGQLYFWRGRGINAASGKRIAVLQVPNFHPDSVIAEASVLFADEPRLDDSRVRAEAEVVWAPGAKGKAYQVDKVLYADERLNLINERYRMDELVQMALRSRSLTTGAEIIVFADLPDERLPASRVFTVAELADDPEADAQEARQVIYEVLREWESLDMESIISLGLVAGEAGGGNLRSSMKGTAPEAYRLARAHPVERSVIEAELVPVQG